MLAIPEDIVQLGVSALDRKASDYSRTPAQIVRQVFGAMSGGQVPSRDAVIAGCSAMMTAWSMGEDGVIEHSSPEFVVFLVWNAMNGHGPDGSRTGPDVPHATPPGLR